MSGIAKALAQNLLRLRNKSGLTQEELGDLIGTTRTSIIRYESGEGGATLATIKKLAKAFNVEDTELVQIEKPAEKVELSKEEWKAIKLRLDQETFDASVGFPRPGTYIPRQVLRGLFQMDEPTRDELFYVLEEFLKIGDKTTQDALIEGWKAELDELQSPTKSNDEQSS